MNIQYLWEFTVTAENLNFSIAADILFLSQSTLSKHISSMEKELNVKLFQRNTRSVTLSKAGELLLPIAKEITAKYALFEQRLAQQVNQQKSSVAILTIPILAQYNITGTIYEFQNLRPDIELKLVEQEAKNIYSLLEKDAFELAFMRIFGELPEQYDCVEFCRDSFVAVLPQSHPMAALSSLPLSFLRDETFLLLDQNTMLDRASKELCESAGFSPKIKFQGFRFENIIDLVSRGIGVSLLMRKHAEYYQTSKIAVTEIEPTLESKICLIWKKNRSLSPAAAAFKRFLQQNAPIAQ